MITAKNCPSTHGAAGYVLGSYWKGDKIVCGFCETEIENPPPSGSRTVYGPWWKFGAGAVTVPMWPDFIKGTPPRA